MIYIITGASHTGKTALAQKLLETKKFPYLSVDHLKMGLIRSGQTNLTPADDDKLTDYLWPIVREFIKTAIENKQNLIIEGCYIPFEWRKDFESQYISEIKFICLALTERYIDEHFEDILAHGSDIEQRFESDEADLSKDFVKKENLRFTEGFKHSGENVILIDQDYEQVIEKLIASSKS